jgi:hypothetical protein
MSRIVFYTLFLFALSASAYTWPPEIIASYPWPADGCVDCVVDYCGYAYGAILANGSPPTIYSIEAESGSVTDTFELNDVPSGVKGLAYDYEQGLSSNKFWVSSSLSDFVYITEDGSVTDSFPIPDGFSGPLGWYDGFLSSELVLTPPGKNTVYHLDPATGSILSSFEGPGSNALDADGRLLADTEHYQLYSKFSDETGWVPLLNLPDNTVALGSFNLFATGRAYGVYTHILVLAEDPNYVYYYAGCTDIAPTSLGSIKAIYR